jgi:DNA-binding NtrC family response regulator
MDSSPSKTERDGDRPEAGAPSDRPDRPSGAARRALAVVVATAADGLCAANEAAARALSLPRPLPAGARIPCSRPAPATPSRDPDCCLGCRFAAVAAAVLGSTAPPVPVVSLGSEGSSGDAIGCLAFPEASPTHVVLARLVVTPATSPKDPEEVPEIVGRHQRLVEVLETIDDLRSSLAPVLILGETGTGKELVARRLHATGPRAGGPFVPVNCGAIPDNLVEDELFGHVRGAFTGAEQRRRGRFDLAAGGTLFLDEIGDLGADLQVKLVRVLEAGEYQPVGSSRSVAADVRIVSATHRDLRTDVASGRFRADLFYRLSVIPISLPALRERLDDLPDLVEHLLDRLAREAGLPTTAIASEALEVLGEHRWPGNVRELGNTLRFAMFKARGGTILPEHLPGDLRARSELARLTTGESLSVEAVASALSRTCGNKVQAARELGVARSTLYRFLARQREED